MSNKFNEWWKTHKIELAFVGFLIFFGLYLSPIIQEAKYKNICVKLSEKGALNKFNEDNIQETLLKETGLSIAELAKIEAYKNCIK